MKRRIAVPAILATFLALFGLFAFATNGQKPETLNGISSAYLALPSLTPGQTIIENPAKPLSKNAGRVVTPKEVLTITDEGASDFYFKWPRKLKVGPDASIYLADEGQLLRFDASGRFVRNYQKKGQGPSEIQWLGDFLVTEKNITALANHPARLVRFDNAGNFEQDAKITIDNGSVSGLLAVHKGIYYIRTAESMIGKGSPNGKIENIYNSILSFSEDSRTLDVGISIPARIFIMSGKGAQAVVDLTSLLATPYQGTSIVLSHTSEYLVKLYDLERKSIALQFRRDYQRVKQPALSEKERTMGAMIGDKPLIRPQEKYKNDIEDIFVSGDDIWVVTSTYEKGKGRLVDVFDGNGRYIDAFYLNLSPAALEALKSPDLCAVQGEYLHLTEGSFDEGFVIKKYRLGI